MLGTAAGGGFPQWNCWCPTCRAVREDPGAGRPRTQSSVAVSADCVRWFLLNASPDVHRQLASLPTTPEGIRHVPVEGIVLTDAELDHSLGLALLREARRLRLYATEAVREILERDSRLLAVTRAFAEVGFTELDPARRVELGYQGGEPSGLSVEAFPVAAGPPRFAPQAGAGHTVGLVIRDERTGGSCAFVPACGELDDALLARLGAVDLVLFDGTFWTDDELIRLGIGERRARELDHVPIDGPDGSLDRLGRLVGPRTVFTHINNTNPMLLERSAERAVVERAGLIVGHDGMRFTL